MSKETIDQPTPENPEEPKGNEGGEAEETVTLSRKEYDKIRKDSEDKQSLIGEIKELREKKQLTESEKEELVTKVKEYEEKGGSRSDDELTPDKIDEIVEKQLSERLSQREKEERERNHNSAISNFKNSHKEFHEDNDEGGLKWSAFERQLGVFNLDSAYSVDEFNSILESAHKLMGGEKNEPGAPPASPDANTPADDPAPAPSSDENKLSDEENALVQDTFGGDKERYLKQKEKRPDYISQLLTYQRMYKS